MDNKEIKNKDLKDVQGGAKLIFGDPEIQATAGAEWKPGAHSIR